MHFVVTLWRRRFVRMLLAGGIALGALNLLLYPLVARRRRRHGPPAIGPDGTVDAHVLLDGCELRADPVAIRGGAVGATLGGVRLDLSPARLAGGDGADVTLTVHVLLGGLSLVVPPDWAVEAGDHPPHVGVDLPPPIDDPAGTLRLEVSGALGGIAVERAAAAP